MKIVVDYKNPETGYDQLKIDSAKYLPYYTIRIKFNDGNKKLENSKPFFN